VSCVEILFWNPPYQMAPGSLLPLTGAT